MAQPISEEFDQLCLHLPDPIQHQYEVIRPVVLFADSVAARIASTGVDRATISEHARRFVQQGMLGLVDRRSTNFGRMPMPFPDPVAAYMLYLKQLYPPIGQREIVRIFAQIWLQH